MGRSFEISVKHLRSTLKAVLPSRPVRGRRSPTVLVVDDEPLIVQGLAAILDREGFTVLTAFDAHSALKLVQKTSPELLITDVNMPGIDGIELAMRLVTALPSLKVLLFSADSEKLKVNFKQQEGNHFSLLSKPVPPQRMLDCVRATLSGTLPSEMAEHHNADTENHDAIIGSHPRTSLVNSLPPPSAQGSRIVARTRDAQMLSLDERLNAKRQFLRTH